MSANTPNQPLKRRLKPSDNHVDSKLIYCVLGLFSLFNTGSTWASDHRPHRQQTTVLVSQSNTLSPEEATEIARQGREIQVLKVKKNNTPLGPIFRVKLLTKKGHVKYVNVDAITGKIVHKPK